MSQVLNRKRVNTVYEFISQKKVYHTFLWLTFIIAVTMYQGKELGYSLAFLNQMIRCFFYGVVVYFNLLYLIPNYLTQTKFLQYSGLLLLTVIVITPISTMIQYFYFFSVENAENYQQELINTQSAQFFLTFIIAGISTVVKIMSEWFRNQRVSAELQKQTMKSELRFLKSQINPHFLFNTLNNLYALTLKKSDKAPEIVLKLSEMMRYMLYECNEKRVPLYKEVNYLKNYLDLEQLRQGGNVKINFDINGEVKSQKIAPLMFIPFLENSFKHGVNNSIANGFVDIKLEVDDREVKMMIANSKASIPQMHHNRRSGGIGLVNVKRRLDLLYPGNYELDIEDNPDVYSVNLKIELVS